MAAREPAPGRLQLVVEFVNTLDVEVGRDELSDPSSLGEWLVETGLLPAPSPPVTDDDVATTGQLREALRSLLAANNGIGSADLQTLNASTHELTLRVVFSGDRDVALRPLESAGVTGALADLVGVVFTAMTDGKWNRLKVCREDTCRWAYYDSSKNRSAAWCSMAVCGNRAKARAYRARVNENAN
ncbi:MAG TPA: CGNR zinc finger domain-containing protein, partial [Acidimicrobiales bacterium]|nr:CGNR zinc finger domain-containing protein [Acidimicrobiales bacterium]